MCLCCTSNSLTNRHSERVAGAVVAEWAAVGAGGRLAATPEAHLQGGPYGELRGAQ